MMKRTMSIWTLCLICAATLAQEQKESTFVRVEQDKLVYDLPGLVANLPVDNAYEAILELPGVALMNTTLTLGGESVTLTLNGETTSMDIGQIATILRNTPVSRVASVEVAYGAQARYMARGRLINVNLAKGEGEEDALRGELYARYRQRHYPGTDERANLFVKKGKLSADLSYAFAHDKEYDWMNEKASYVHSYQTVHSRINTHNVLLSANYLIAPGHSISLAYNGRLSDQATDGTRERIIGWSMYEEPQTTQDNYNTDTYVWLHNARLDYRTPFGLRAGAEFAYQHPLAEQSSASVDYNYTMLYQYRTSQYYNTWKIYLTEEHRFGGEWGLNYGIVYLNGLGRDYQWREQLIDYDDDMQMPDYNFQMEQLFRQRVQTLDLFVGLHKGFDKFSIDASVTGRYRIEAAPRKWWTWHPAIGLTYTLSPAHLFRLNLDGLRRDVVKAYAEVDPELKPTYEYGASLTYLLRGKYFFSAWFAHADDHYMQRIDQMYAPYGRDYTYVTDYSNYLEQAGVQASLPLDVARWLDIRLVLTGAWQHEKMNENVDDGFDARFNRVCFWGMGRATATFTLPTNPDLKFTLSGMVRSFMLQEDTDLPSISSVDASLRYTFLGGKATAKLYADDLFRGARVVPRSPSTSISFARRREIGASFVWRFGS